MQKKVKKSNPKFLKDADKKHTAGVRGGAQPAKNISEIGKNVTQPVKRFKSGTKKKTKSRTRGRNGAMQKGETGTTFRPFMM